MKLVACLAVALAMAEASSAKLMKAAEHPAGHLFARGHNDDLPVRQYGGEDPQAHLIVNRRAQEEEALKHGRRFHHDHLNVLEMAPRHLRDEAGNFLSKRQASTQSVNLKVNYPPAGNDAPDPKLLPQAWVDKYNQVKKAGLIPDIPLSIADPTAGVRYPAGTDAAKACSWTVSKCNTGDIYQAPDGIAAMGLDDGPTSDGTPLFLQTLNTENVSVTHFLIGSAIIWNTPAFQKLAAATPQQHLGVHTWSHTLQTSKTDLEVLGDLGWVQQIIYDYTGLIPAYWRPPEGDVDARVRAIAKYVLGMQTVLWTDDADDWCLREGTGTATSIDSCKKDAPDLKTVQDKEVAWFSPKTSNTGKLTLSHETTDQASKAFAAYLAAAKKEGWTIAGTVPDMQGLNWYSNAFAKGDKGTKQDNILPTKAFINVTNAKAPKGSADAPDLGDWTKSAATVKSNSSTQGSSTAAKSGSSSKSGASNLAVSATMVLGAFSAVVALTL